MKNKILLSVVMVLMIILIMILSYAEKNDYTIPIEPEKGEEPIKIRLLNEADNTVTEINLEDYIVGVVASEMPASFEKEALKAQAVAARTYAMNKKESRSSLNYDLIIGTKDQAYQDNRALLSKWGINFFSNYLKIREAVKDTQSLVLTYEDKIINANIEGLNLKTKWDFFEYRSRTHKTEFNINSVSYKLHGNGFFVFDKDLF